MTMQNFILLFLFSYSLRNPVTSFTPHRHRRHHPSTFVRQSYYKSTSSAYYPSSTSLLAAAAKSSETKKRKKFPPSKVVDVDGPTPEVIPEPIPVVDNDEMEELKVDPNLSLVPHQPWRKGDAAGCEAPIHADWRREAEEIIQVAVDKTGAYYVGCTWYLDKLIIFIDDDLSTVPDDVHNMEGYNLRYLLPDKGPKWFDDDTMPEMRYDDEEDDEPGPKKPGVANPADEDDYKTFEKIKDTMEDPYHRFALLGETEDDVHQTGEADDLVYPLAIKRQQENMTRTEYKMWKVAHHLEDQIQKQEHDTGPPDTIAVALNAKGNIVDIINRTQDEVEEEEDEDGDGEMMDVEDEEIPPDVIAEMMKKEKGSRKRKKKKRKGPEDEDDEDDDDDDEEETINQNMEQIEAAVAIDERALSFVAYHIMEALSSRDVDNRLDIIERHQIIMAGPPPDHVLEMQQQFDDHVGDMVTVQTKDPWGSNRAIRGRLVDRNTLDVYINKKGRLVTIPQCCVSNVMLYPPPVEEEEWPDEEKREEISMSDEGKQEEEEEDDEEEYEEEEDDEEEDDEEEYEEEEEDDEEEYEEEEYEEEEYE